ncbi:MAG: PIN domain-containing protein [Candidatus Hydrothermarchaeales archaeon]
MGSSYRLVFDSNFLLLPFQFGVDIFSELKELLDVNYKIYVTRGVLRELTRLSQRKGVEGRRAKAALESAMKLELIESNEDVDVDEGLAALAAEGAVICTNDKALKERIRKNRAPVVYLRQKKYLILEGYLR